ncbi:hypothetical protein SpCBS45565_g01613 [Spizellomyces sp. 'palustris']|nr:hypothetical protein SpCBS45565_g01613 [Spizellomyces sp. 'palustris']
MEKDKVKWTRYQPSGGATQQRGQLKQLAGQPAASPPPGFEEEIECSICERILPWDHFSRRQRRMNDKRRCIACVKEAELTGTSLRPDIAKCAEIGTNAPDLAILHYTWKEKREGEGHLKKRGKNVRVMDYLAAEIQKSHNGGLGWGEGKKEVSSNKDGWDSNDWFLPEQKSKETKKQKEGVDQTGPTERAQPNGSKAKANVDKDACRAAKRQTMKELRWGESQGEDWRGKW